MIHDLLETQYRINDRDRIESFLRENVFLLDLLGQIYTKTEKYICFSKIFLEVVADPESENDKQLVVSVLPDMDPVEADKRLDQFDDEWWLDQIDQTKGKLCITLEFR